MTSTGLTARRRNRLGDEQGWLCPYCKRPVGLDLPRQQQPIVEHYHPRWTGARGPDRLKLVLACDWCDKTKGMMDGQGFEELILAQLKGREFITAMTDIAKAAAKKNTELGNIHQPLLMRKAKEKRYSVPMQPSKIYSSPKIQAKPKMAELFPNIRGAIKLKGKNNIRTDNEGC